MKNIRSWGTVERRKNGRWRARTGKDFGWKDIGHYDTKEEAERAIEEFKLKHGVEVDEQLDEVGQDSKPFAEVSKDSVEISTGIVSEPITNWDSILLSFGLDPDIFEIVDDRVRMSKWQTSKRLESGERDLVWLYSYKALFRKRHTPAVKEFDITELRKIIQTYKPQPIKKTLEAPSTFVILWADWQLAKSASGGVRATTDRIVRSFDASIQRIKDLRKLGRNIEEIAL